MIKKDTSSKNYRMHSLILKTKRTITFSTAYMYIIIGFAFNFFTFQFFYLQYILPFIGTLLFTIGFSAFRKGNSEFKNTYTCSLIYTLVSIANLILLATPFSQIQRELIDFIRAIILLFVILYFVSALKELFHQVDKKGPALLNYIWSEYLIIIAFTFFTMIVQEFFSFIIALIVLCLYITILVQFIKVKNIILHQEIEVSIQKTYRILPAVILILLIITMILASLYINERRQILTYTAWNNDNTKAENEILKKKGLPESILQDLRHDDMLRLNNVSDFQHKRQKLNFYNPYITNEYAVDVYYGYESDSIMQILVYFDFDKLPTQNTLSFMTYIQSTRNDDLIKDNKTSIVALYDKDNITYMHYATTPFTTHLSKGSQHRGYVLLSYESDYQSILSIIPSLKYKNSWTRYPYTATRPLSIDLLSASTADNILTALTYDTTSQFQIVMDAITVDKTRGISHDTEE